MTSLNTVSTVFGGTAPHRLKELYGVDFAEGGAAPASGAINLLAFTGKSPVLYAFTQHTFTSAGQSGRTGPTLAQCRNAYTVPWDTNTTFFNVSHLMCVHFYISPLRRSQPSMLVLVVQ